MVRDCTNTFQGATNSLSRKRPGAANALGKISEWKEGGFSNVRQTEGFCLVECELRPRSRAEKARIRPPQSLSSQYLIRNLGAGPWPGTDPHTLSRHSVSLSLTRSPTQGGQTEGRGHSLKGSTGGKFSHFTSVFVPCSSIMGGKGRAGA